MAPRAPAARSAKPGHKHRARRSSQKSDHLSTFPSGSVGEWVRYLWPQALDQGAIPVWPPDAFAIGAAYLRRTGAYIGLVNGRFRRKHAHSVLPPQEVESLGEKWRNILSDALKSRSTSKTLRESCPSQIVGWWAEVRRCASMPLAESDQDVGLVCALINLTIVSDAASVGIGVSIIDEDYFLAQAQAQLAKNSFRSFCLHVAPIKVAVLAKQHTPQRGCTIRSLSHNLALYSPTEINAYWRGPLSLKYKSLDVLNLLLLPWPSEIATRDFSVSTDRGRQAEGESNVPNRYFDYEPSKTENPRVIADRVERAIKKSREYCGQIHAIVFPEVALSPEQFLAIEKVAIRHGAVCISGLRAPGSRTTMPSNACVIQPFGLTTAQASGASATQSELQPMRYLQFKHHRWCLDRQQIIQYELGGRLPASYDCWERVRIEPRDINFVTVNEWLTMCVLICEDLARQDPVTEVIRAVGPNIVFTLLMDGPQLKNRWSSRYASVLAEDPGCSVLSLTSLGMSKRSRASGDGPKEDKSSTIALWRDAIFGEREIAMQPGHDSCVLSLVCRSQEEFSIDGRGDGKEAHFPVYAGSSSFLSHAVPVRRKTRSPRR